MSEERLPTKERLAQAIKERMGDKYDPRVERMIGLARNGVYDDFESEIAAPTTQLVRDLRQVGYHDLAQRVIDGEFDGTKEEGEAWMQREGWGLLMGEQSPEDEQS